MIDRDPAVDRTVIPRDLQEELEEQFGAPRPANNTEFGGPGTASLPDS